MGFRHPTLLLIVSLSLPIAVQAGPLIIDDGDTFLVLAGEQLTTGDVQVNGTFRNLGNVTNTGLFENFGLTDNEGFFTNLGEFRSDGFLYNEGTFVNNGSLVTGAAAVIDSFGTFISTGYFENHATHAGLSQFNISGVLDNHGNLSTLGGIGVNTITGNVTNTGNFANGGQLELGSQTPGGTMFNNGGSLYNGGRMDVIGDTQFVNSGTVTNQSLLTMNHLINNGELINYGTLTIGGAGGPGISGDGEVYNDQTMTVSQSALTIEGGWGNFGTMTLVTEVLRIEGGLTVYGRNTSITGDVEVTEFGELTQHGSFRNIDIGGRLVNRGFTYNQYGGMNVGADVENHYIFIVEDQLDTRQFVQHDGRIEINGGVLQTPGVQIYGGLLIARYGVGIGEIRGLPSLGPETQVEMFSGTISGGANGLAIRGGLVLYDDATMQIDVRRDGDLELAGDIAATGEIALAGTLVVNLGPGTAVTGGDIWTLASGLTISGMFDNLVLPSVAGISFDVFVSDSGAPGGGFQQLQMQAIQAVPLPGALVLFIGATGVLVGFRRQRKSFATR